MKKCIWFCVFLMGCSLTNNEVIIEKEPLPNIEPPKHLKLEVCQWDIPRKMDETYILNTSECKEIENQEIKPTWFKSKCIKNPVDTKSNLILGFDQDNYLCFIKNQQIIRSVIQSYDERINLINTNNK